MHPRLYRLAEIHQRIDRTLRAEMRHRWHDPVRIAKLQRLKLRVKVLMRRLVLQPGRA